VVDGAASKATAARLAASPSAASARDGAFANGAKPSAAARVRASLEGELRRENAAGLRSTRASDQVSKLLIHIAGTIRVVPTIPLSQQGTIEILSQRCLGRCGRVSILQLFRKISMKKVVPVLAAREGLGLPE
jgi:hypothetical protein